MNTDPQSCSNNNYYYDGLTLKSIHSAYVETKAKRSDSDSSPTFGIFEPAQNSSIRNTVPYKAARFLKVLCANDNSKNLKNTELMKLYYQTASKQSFADTHDNTMCASMAVIRFANNGMYICKSGNSFVLLLRKGELVNLAYSNSGYMCADLNAEPYQICGKIHAGDRIILCSEDVVNALGIDSLKNILTSEPDTRMCVESICASATDLHKNNYITTIVVDVIDDRDATPSNLPEFITPSIQKPVSTVHTSSPISRRHEEEEDYLDSLYESDSHKSKRQDKRPQKEAKREKSIKPKENINNQKEKKRFPKPLMIAGIAITLLAILLIIIEMSVGGINRNTSKDTEDSKSTVKTDSESKTDNNDNKYEQTDTDDKTDTTYEDNKAQIAETTKSEQTSEQTTKESSSENSEPTSDNVTYKNGILIANKTYSLPASYNPGGLTSETSVAFNKLSQAAAADGMNIYVQSGFRSYETQRSLYNNYVARDGQAAADTYSARPGYSEHQTGLAIDVNSDFTEAYGRTPEGIWLAENCYKYGFIIRYPQGKESVTGYQYEPWHIRYLGVSTATKVYNSGLTLEEYLGITSQYKD